MREAHAAVDLAPGSEAWGLGPGPIDGPTRAYGVFGKVKALVTKADGMTEVKTLSDLDITDIDLTGDATLTKPCIGSFGAARCGRVSYLLAKSTPSPSEGPSNERTLG